MFCQWHCAILCNLHGFILQLRYSGSSSQHNVLGQSRSTNETIVGTAEGVVRASATRRQDVDERWKGDLIKKPRRTPARPDSNRVQLMTPMRVRFDPPQVGEPDPTMQPWKEPQMRPMKITESMLQKYRYPEGCEGCRAKAAGMTQKLHGEAFRKRIEQAST